MRGNVLGVVPNGNSGILAFYPSRNDVGAQSSMLLRRKARYVGRCMGAVSNGNSEVRMFCVAQERRRLIA